MLKVGKKKAGHTKRERSLINTVGLRFVKFEFLKCKITLRLWSTPTVFIDHFLSISLVIRSEEPIGSALFISPLRNNYAQPHKLRSSHHSFPVLSLTQLNIFTL